MIVRWLAGCYKGGLQGGYKVESVLSQYGFWVFARQTWSGYTVDSGLPSGRLAIAINKAAGAVRQVVR